MADDPKCRKCEARCRLRKKVERRQEEKAESWDGGVGMRRLSLTDSDYGTNSTPSASGSRSSSVAPTSEERRSRMGSEESTEASDHGCEDGDDESQCWMLDADDADYECDDDDDLSELSLTKSELMRLETAEAFEAGVEAAGRVLEMTKIDPAHKSTRWNLDQMLHKWMYTTAVEVWMKKLVGRSLEERRIERKFSSLKRPSWPVRAFLTQELNGFLSPVLNFSTAIRRLRSRSGRALAQCLLEALEDDFAVDLEVLKNCLIMEEAITALYELLNFLSSTAVESTEEYKSAVEAVEDMGLPLLRDAIRKAAELDYGRGNVVNLADEPVVQVYISHIVEEGRREKALQKEEEGDDVSCLKEVVCIERHQKLYLEPVFASTVLRQRINAMQLYWLVKSDTSWNAISPESWWWDLSLQLGLEDAFRQTSHRKRNKVLRGLTTPHFKRIAVAALLDATMPGTEGLLPDDSDPSNQDMINVDTFLDWAVEVGAAAAPKRSNGKSHESDEQNLHVGRGFAALLVSQLAKEFDSDPGTDSDLSQGTASSSKNGGQEGSTVPETSCMLSPSFEFFGMLRRRSSTAEADGECCTKFADSCSQIRRRAYNCLNFSVARLAALSFQWETLKAATLDAMSPRERKMYCQRCLKSKQDLNDLLSHKRKTPVNRVLECECQTGGFLNVMETSIIVHYLNIARGINAETSDRSEDELVTLTYRTWYLHDVVCSARRALEKLAIFYEGGPALDALDGSHIVTGRGYSDPLPIEQGTCRPVNQVLNGRFLVTMSRYALIVLGGLAAPLKVLHEKDAAGPFVKDAVLVHENPPIVFFTRLRNAWKEFWEAAKRLDEAGETETALEIMTNIHRLDGRSFSVYQSGYVRRRKAMEFCGDVVAAGLKFTDAAELHCNFTRPEMKSKLKRFELDFVVRFKGSDSTPTYQRELGYNFTGLRNELEEGARAMGKIYETIQVAITKAKQQKKRGSSEEGLWSKSDLLADTMSRMIHSCTFCSAPTVPLKRCPTCRLARYCSEECRDRYAAHHSLVCARSKADVVAKFLEVSPIDVEELHSGLRKDKGRRVREMAEARNDHVNTLFRCIFDVKNAVLTATADENKDE